MDELIKDLRSWAKWLETWERDGYGRFSPQDLLRLSIVCETAADTIETLRSQRDHARDLARTWGGFHFEQDKLHQILDD